MNYIFASSQPDRQNAPLDGDIELLIRQATPMIFGIFGHTVDVDQKRIVRVGGSGIFIAPFLALTARHVNRDLLKMDWRGERPPNRGYFETQFSSALLQVLDPFGKAPRNVIWQVDRIWDTDFTDIAFMQVSAENGATVDAMQMRWFDWALMPPPIGSQVVMLGYPSLEITPVDDKMNINLRIVRQVGRVSEIHKLRRERGMMSFPCFHIDKPIDHGFSGGPVFWRGRLCGIVSSGSPLSGGTYAATLWPFCLMEYQYEYPGFGSLGGKTTIGDLFEKRVLHSEDWSALRYRISRRHNENGPYAHIEE